MLIYYLLGQLFTSKVIGEFVYTRYGKRKRIYYNLLHPNNIWEYDIKVNHQDKQNAKEIKGRVIYLFHFSSFFLFLFSLSFLTLISHASIRNLFILILNYVKNLQLFLFIYLSNNGRYFSNKERFSCTLLESFDRYTQSN